MLSQNKAGGLFLSLKLSACWIWHRFLYRIRCRGFIGPVPLPLLIRKIYLIFINPMRLLSLYDKKMDFFFSHFQKNKKPLLEKEEGIIRKNRPLLIYQDMLAGIGTVHLSPLPRCHRASPSTSLDKKYLLNIRFC